jgi:hypothetical protein
MLHPYGHMQVTWALKLQRRLGNVVFCLVAKGPAAIFIILGLDRCCQLQWRLPGVF